MGLAVGLTRFLPLSITLQSVVSMLGLGLGIDYALLTVSRFREAMGGRGRRPRGRRRGGAPGRRHGGVSGAAVAVGFLGLAARAARRDPRRGRRRPRGHGAAVALATTLLPAVLAVLGPRVDALAPAPPAAAAPGPGRPGPLVARCVTAARCRGALGDADGSAGWPATRLTTDLPGGDWLPRLMESTERPPRPPVPRPGGRRPGSAGPVELPEDAQALGREGWGATRRLADVLADDPRIEQVPHARRIRPRARRRPRLRQPPPRLPQALLRRLRGRRGARGGSFRAKTPPAELGRSRARAAAGRRRDADGVPRLAPPRGRPAGLQRRLRGRRRGPVLPRSSPWSCAGRSSPCSSGFRSLLVPLKAVALNLLSVAPPSAPWCSSSRRGTARAGSVSRRRPAGSSRRCRSWSSAWCSGSAWTTRCSCRPVGEARRAGRGDAEALAEGLVRTGG